MKTPKGTQLQILNLKGKEYLPVAQRILWFREENPLWSIETTPVRLDENIAIFRADITAFFKASKDHDVDSMRLIAQAHKSETPKGFADYIEKAETGAIGRALALCGYGTQFVADELDEGTRLADSPIARAASPAPSAAPQPSRARAASSPNEEYPACLECGKKMMKSKFETGPKFYCPNKKNHMPSHDSPPPF